MTRIAGALAMGLLFLMISANLRARFVDGLAAVAGAVDRCGVLAYAGLSVVVVGGLLIVLARGSTVR